MAGVTDVVHKEEVGAREGLCADLVCHESVQSTLHLQLRERLEVRDVEHGGLKGLLPNGLKPRERPAEAKLEEESADSRRRPQQLYSCMPLAVAM